MIRLPARSRRVARLSALALVAAFGGCGTIAPPPAPAAGAAPTRAILYADTLTVEMSDRSFCTGPRGRQGRSWQGRLQGCPHLWPYRASLPPGPVARLPLRPGDGGAGRVEIDAPGGVLVFSGGG